VLVKLHIDINPQLVHWNGMARIGVDNRLHLKGWNVRAEAHKLVEFAVAMAMDG
jgi:hypothetical protein